MGLPSTIHDEPLTLNIIESSGNVMLFMKNFIIPIKIYILCGSKMLFWWTVEMFCPIDILMCKWPRLRVKCSIMKQQIVRKHGLHMLES